MEFDTGRNYARIWPPKAAKTQGWGSPTREADCGEPLRDRRRESLPERPCASSGVWAGVTSFCVHLFGSSL